MYALELFRSVFSRIRTEYEPEQLQIRKLFIYWRSRLDWIWIHTSRLNIASSWYIPLQSNFFLELFRIFKYTNKHGDLSLKVSIGYPVLYLQKLFTCRKLSVVLIVLSRNMSSAMFYEKIVLQGTSSPNFFCDVSSLTVIVFCLLKELSGKPLLRLSYEGNCKHRFKHGTIIRTGITCKESVL